MVQDYLTRTVRQWIELANMRDYFRRRHERWGGPSALPTGGRLPHAARRGLPPSELPRGYGRPMPWRPAWLVSTAWLQRQVPALPTAVRRLVPGAVRRARLHQSRRLEAAPFTSSGAAAAALSTGGRQSLPQRAAAVLLRWGEALSVCNELYHFPQLQGDPHQDGDGWALVHGCFSGGHPDGWVVVHPMAGERPIARSAYSAMMFKEQPLRWTADASLDTQYTRVRRREAAVRRAARLREAMSVEVRGEVV